jgi:hypothetical protein
MASALRKLPALVEQPHEDDGLVELVEALQQVDTNKPLARLNESSIADNNGGRIEL